MGFHCPTDATKDTTDQPTTTPTGSEWVNTVLFSFFLQSKQYRFQSKSIFDFFFFTRSLFRFLSSSKFNTDT
jgi:hypothetical protein